MGAAKYGLKASVAVKRMTAVVKFEVVGGYDEATGVGDGEQHQQIIGIGTKRDRGCVAHSAIMHI